MGDLMQCRGVADALVRDELFTARIENFAIREAVISQSTLTRIPCARVPVSRADDYLYQAPLPDIIIASGRRTISHLRNFKRKGSEKGEKPPYVIFLKHPRIGQRFIDFMWLPAHDSAVPDVPSIRTNLSPHAISREILQQASDAGQTRFEDYPAPRTSVILGGNSKSVRWDRPAIDAFTSALSQLPQEGSVLVTASRRTPSALVDEVRTRLAGHRVWIWDGEGDNPYTQMLAVADRIIVTGDSHNMVSEAVATHAWRHVFRPPGLSRKLAEFLDNLESLGFIQDLSRGFGPASRSYWNQTEEIAQAAARHFRDNPPRRVHPLWG